MRQKLTILILLSLLAFAGCNNSGTDKARELELKEKELALKEKELELTKKNPKAVDSDKTEKPEKTETPKPLKKVEPPSGATVAIINASDVVARAQPSLTAKKVTLLKKGQKVYVTGISDNLVLWEGEYLTMRKVQLENGQTGWVLNKFIDET
jgi:hypothetical protein